MKKYWLMNGIIHYNEETKIRCSLEQIVVVADSLDEAVEKARKLNPGYCGGRIVRVIK